MKRKSEALKRVPIKSVEETVDAAMEYLPQSLDLSLPESRKKIRDWMVRICAVVTQRNVDGFAAAAKSAIDEAGALAIDPHYYSRVTKQRNARKARRAAVVVVQNMSREEKAFASIRDSKVVM